MTTIAVCGEASVNYDISGIYAMKLRPVLLVVLLLAGFYYVTTHLASTGTLSPWLEELHPAGSAANVATLRGSDGAFDLNVASAAPAFDAEEQQNIAVYKKALPSVVNITATEVRFDFFYRRCRSRGRGLASSSTRTA